MFCKRPLFFFLEKTIFSTSKTLGEKEEEEEEGAVFEVVIKAKSISCLLE